MAEEMFRYDMIEQKTFRDMANMAASFYVRIRVPCDTLATTSHPKQLTMDNVKFGIANCLTSRDYGYMDDNGYMAFSFECTSRYEASIVEMIMRNEFADLTVMNSFEYLDVRGLAERLGHEYVHGSYENYVELARKLFVHMVETAKLIFPNKYLGKYGFVHCKGRIRGEIISPKMAADFGFKTPSVTWTPVDLEAESPKPVAAPAHVPPKRRPVTALKTMRKVKIIDFSEVRQLALDPEGEADAATMQQYGVVSAHDVAAIRLFYATRMWMVDPTKVDERFYLEYASGHNETYRKAKRFELLMKENVTGMQASMADKLATFAESKCSGINNLITRIKDDFSMLIIGCKFIQLCVNPEEMAELNKLNPVKITAQTMSEAFQALKRDLTHTELSQMYQLFDLKKTCTDLIALKKMLAMTFNISVARQSSRTDCKGFMVINISPHAWKAMREAYDSRLLAFDD
jgi:hypothetical protein